MATENEKYLHPRESKLDLIVKRFEEVIFSVIIISMIVMGLIPIVMRYTGMPGISWPESLSQQMVLWIAFLGAGVAIRERSSISIDALPHLLNTRKRLFLRGITELISAVVCGILVWVSIAFVRMNIEFDADAIAFLGVREWWLIVALPVGFFLLTLRLLIASFEDIFNTFHLKFDECDPESEENA